MPYEIIICKTSIYVPPEDGDDGAAHSRVIAGYLRPAIVARFPEILFEPNRESWLIGAQYGETNFCIEVKCDDLGKGIYRIWLAAFVKRCFGRKVADTPGLEKLRKLIEQRLAGWTDQSIRVDRVAP